MFTGIVTAMGEISSIERRDSGLDLAILSPYSGIEDGESIAVSGACLTVFRRGPGWFGVHAVGTTLDRTRFGELSPGETVNLERAVRAGDRLGGHLVQGHVDGLGTVVAIRPLPDGRLVEIEVPVAVERVTIPLGSLTVDGVSLTVNAMLGGGIIQVSLVPYTLGATTLGGLVPGNRVHLEGDVIGKYVQAFMQRGVVRE